jgi:hypothetical protein
VRFTNKETLKYMEGTVSGRLQCSDSDSVGCSGECMEN